MWVRERLVFALCIKQEEPVMVCWSLFVFTLSLSLSIYSRFFVCFCLSPFDGLSLYLAPLVAQEVSLISQGGLRDYCGSQ